MNIDTQIKEWAESCKEDVEESKSILGNRLMLEITGRYQEGPEPDIDEFLMPTFDTKTMKWIVLAMMRNYRTNKIMEANPYSEQEFDSIDDAVQYIRDLESDDGLEKGDF